MDSGVLLCTDSSFDWNDIGVIYKYTCTWDFRHIRNTPIIDYKGQGKGKMWFGKW